MRCRRTRRTRLTCVTCLLVLTGSGTFGLPAWAQEPAPDEAPAAAKVADPARSDAITLLDAARAALEKGDRDTARTILRRLRRQYPDALATAELAQLLGQPRPTETLRLQRREGKTRWTREDFERDAPKSGKRQWYARATGERLKLHPWEIADYVVTGAAYGAAIGGAWALAVDAEDNLEAAIGLGTITYAALGVLHLGAGSPNRDDLPLALGIASYVPLTALLVGLAADDHDGETTALAVALSGTLALPVAGLAAAYTDLDPGDVQLTRDAGFWGTVLAMAATSFSCRDRYCSGEDYGIAGLLGLYCGLGLGAVIAANTEVSLDRVRVMTLVGYAGAAIGALAFSVANAGDGAPSLAIMLGGSAGLLVGGIATTKMDLLPSNAILVDGSPNPTPGLVVMPIVDRTGAILPALGMELLR